MSARSRLAAGLGAIAPAVALAVALTITTIPGPAAAQTPRGFPAKPVRIVTVGPGSQGDVLSRLLAPKLAEIWGQPVVVENRAGAGGTLAAATVAKATPDGYTFLLQSNQFAVSAALHANLPYDPIRDFAGISQLGNGTVVLYVPPSLGPRTVKELIALAHAKPVLLYSSSGAGSGAHLNNEMFRYAAGIKDRKSTRLNSSH